MRAIVLCVIFSVIGAAQVPQSSIESSLLANAIRQPNAHIYSSSHIATLQSEGSRAVFTGLIVADPAQQDRKIRGIRIDFSDAGWNRMAYVDEAKLEPLKDVVDRLSADLERSLPLLASRNREGFLGSCELRDHPEAYPVHVDYCYSGWCSPGLRITSPTMILFTNRKPSDLSAILGSAIEYLKPH
jgi:hypothetical protein